MLSPEVQATVDEIRRTKNIQKAQAASIKLMGEKIADLQAKVDAIPVHKEMSQADKDALTREVSELDALNDELEGAVPANTSNPSNGGNPNVPGGASTGQINTGAPGGFIEPTPPEHNPDAPRAEAMGGTGQNGTVPLMPTSAFDPAGGVKPPLGDAGQPNQPAAIETAGGFVIAGGGSTARAPGSRPESPSSSLVIPEDPNAKAPASTADEVKSGLGDSSQNALLGNDGRPISEGPGIVGEVSADTARREQERQDALNAEMERRRANPLNLSEEDLKKREQADAGKGTADDEARKRAESEKDRGAGPTDRSEGNPAAGPAS